MGEWVRPIALTVGLTIVYFLAARFSLSLLTQPDSVAVFWPAAGIATGALIRMGPIARIPIVAGTIAATILANLVGDRNILTSIVFGACNAGEAVLVAGLVERTFTSPFRLDALNHVMGLVAAAIVGPAASGIGAALGFLLFHSSAASPLTIWWHWFASDAIGIITVAPLFIEIPTLFTENAVRAKELFEGLLALLILAVVVGVVVQMQNDIWAGEKAIAAVVPFLLWIAVRCRPAFAAAAALVCSIGVFWTTVFGIGFFGDPSLPIGERALPAQASAFALSVFELTLAALFAERKRAEEHQNLLVAELDHRVKNLLARVSAIATYTREGSSSIDDFSQALDRRLHSLSTAHSLLSESRWHGVDLLTLVQHQLAPYKNGANVFIDGPRVALTAVATQAVAMVLHELVTNAVKYGALSTAIGRVSVKWLVLANGSSPKCVMVEWREMGGPTVVAPAQSCYGTNLIRDLIPHELGGTAELEFAAEGVHCRIEFSL
jgi:two-component sensor histidine kinase/integral membrane sensor domain MASE1